MKTAEAAFLLRDAEARGQVFVDRENFVVVIRLDENVADENAREDRAEGELEVGVIAQREAFAGRAEKCAGAGFGRDDGSEHRPPRNAPAAEREIFEVILLPAHAEADEDDDEEIEEENAGSRSTRRASTLLGDRIRADRKLENAVISRRARNLTHPSSRILHRSRLWTAMSFVVCATQDDRLSGCMDNSDDEGLVQTER